MKLGILAVGHKPPDWVAKGCSEYIKRMPKEMPLSIFEIKPEIRGSKTRDELLATEKTRLQSAKRGFVRTIVLDERGEDWTTLKLAQRLESWMMEGGNTAFIIGSADGLDQQLKERANAQIRLSSFTLPHAIARLVLCEQLYRAASIIKNHPYHREE